MMGTLTRSIGLIIASAGSAAVLAVSGAPSAIGADQALFLNGLAAGELTPIVMASILHGAFTDYNRVAVSWPEQANPVTGQNSLSLSASVATGVTNLTAAVTTALAQTSAGEHVTVVGLSAGSLVADEYLRQLVASGNAPDKSKLNFVVVADGDHLWLNSNNYNKILNYTFQAPPATQYDTTVVTGEYDGFADFPNRPLNVVADLNALAGIIVVHVPDMFADLSTVPASNITSTTNSLGGVTTNYLVPTATLPLVTLFPFLKPQEAALKKIVDAGYTRNDAASGASNAVSATSASASAVAASAPDTSTPAADSVVTATKVATTAPKAASSVGTGAKAGVSRRSNAAGSTSAGAAAATRSTRTS